MISSLGNTLKERAIEKRGISHELVLEKEDWNWKKLEEVGEDLVFQATITDNYIGILYDPDVDGLFSGHLMEDYLTRMGLDNKIKRHMSKNKVHGMGEEAINWVKEEEIRMLIVVDAGSGDADLIQELVGDNDNVLEQAYIIDHHDYKHSNQENPNVHLINVIDRPDLPPVSGCGVVYKVLESTEGITGIDTSRYERFVGITILSDVCRMDVNENRYYVSKSYEAIQEGKAPFDAFAYYGSGASLISYNLVPLLNAMIRTNRIEQAFRFLYRMQKGRLKTFVQQELRAKKEQKERVKGIKGIGKLLYLEGMTISLRPHQEVNYQPFNGLYANELMGENRSGAMVLELSEDKKMVRGSFRGWHYGKDVLEEWGFSCAGHHKACGVWIDIEGFSNFIDKFSYKGELEVNYDGSVYLHDLNEEDWLMFAHFNEYAGNGCEAIRFKVLDEPLTCNVVRTRTLWQFDEGVQVTDFSTQAIGKEGMIVEPTEKYENYTLLRKVEGD